VLNVVAHPDDDLLFLSPALLVSLKSGAPVHTVFLTAGDDGRAAWYWHQRERGIRAAYAQMSQVPDGWVPAPGAEQSVVTLRLDAAPQVSVSFLRLPDGGHGGGFVRYGHRSLPRLWRGEQPTITAVDRSATYSRGDLIDTVLAIMQADRPATVRTQDFTGRFGDGDHDDHHVAGYVTRAASDRFGSAHRLESYQDYPIAGRPANVTGALLRDKTAAFIAYAAHDRSVCVPGRRACTRRAYPSWVRREYLLASR
jgi:LmbE family N-acetylglucosaminyl deacetylase